MDIEEPQLPDKIVTADIEEQPPAPPPTVHIDVHDPVDPSPEEILKVNVE